MRFGPIVLRSGTSPGTSCGVIWMAPNATPKLHMNSRAVTIEARRYSGWNSSRMLGRRSVPAAGQVQGGNVRGEARADAPGGGQNDAPEQHGLAAEAVGQVAAQEAEDAAAAGADEDDGGGPVADAGEAAVGERVEALQVRQG